MKYLLITLLSLVSFLAKAQFPTQTVPTQFSTGYFKQGWHQADSGHILANRSPNFTAKNPGTTILYQQAGVDTSIHYWTGSRWIKITSSVDTTSLSNRINLKLNISDTTGKWLSQSSRLVDTIYRVNDSTVGYTIKGTAYTFQIKGGASGGGGSGLTSVGLSMPSAFTVTGSPLTSNGSISVSGAGTSSQYIRGNGTLATTDTGMIPNFHLKVRSLLSGVSPITFNQTTGVIGITNANTSGTKGAATFNSSYFTDNGSGLISLTTPVSSGTCTNCNLTLTADGRVTAYADGSSGGGSITNASGPGDTLAISSGSQIKRLRHDATLIFSTNSNAILLGADTNSYIATKYDLTTVGGGANNMAQSFLGSIYSSNSWANLSDFAQTGGVTASASGGKINISAGAGTFTQTLDVNWYSMLERWKMTCRFKVTSTASGTTYGIGIGMHSTNGYGAVNALGRIDLTNSGAGGKVILNGHTDNQQMAISSTALPFVLNDTIELRVERKVDSIRVTAINRTQGNATVTAVFKYNLTTGIPQLPNTGRFGIFAFGGTQAIDSISITSEEIKNAVALTVGDSKTQGYYAQTFDGRYTSLFNTKVPTTVLHAGGYDRTTEWITYLPELKLLNPKQVLLTNPSNDMRSGISSGTSQAQYEQIVDSLVSWGVEVFHGLAFFETAQDNSAWNTFITSNYSADRIIDFWGATKNCTGCVDGDGVHLTALGNDTAYKTQLWSYKMNGGSNNVASGGSSFSGTDNTLAMFSAGTLVNSSVYQDASRVYMSKGFESSTTDPGFDLYKTNAGTDEKGWNIYSDATSMYIAAFNDARSSVSNAIKINRTGTTINYTAIPNGSFIVGSSTDPGSYQMSVVTAGAAIARFRTTNTAGAYIGLENGTAPKAYIGLGSVLTTGASPNDVTIRSQDDTIHFSNNLGTSMAKFANGKIYVTSHALGSNSDSALIWDRTTKEYKYAKINSGGITSINSQTGATQFINGGTGITVNSATNTHTISINPSYITSGTYTPTLTNVSNVGSSTAYQCQYMIVGNVCTVSGKVDIDPSSVGTFQLGMSLPASTAFASDFECGGTATAGSTENLDAAIRADAANERAEFIGTLPVGASISNNAWFFTFTYLLTGT